jgi:methylmalonyl-CoA/ethylmalonyl-CoA epimerase
VISGIHHLGVATDDLAATVSRYRRLLGARVDHEAVVVDQGVRAVSLAMPEGPAVELLAPTGPDTPVGRFLERRGPGMHHVGYLTDDLLGELARLEGEGAELVDATPRSGLFGLQVAFLHPGTLHGVLTELVQPERGSVA